MQVQTVFKAGNSSVVTLPRNLGFKPGDEVVVDKGLSDGTAFISKANSGGMISSVTPDFLNILNGINKRYGRALSELAQK